MRFHVLGLPHTVTSKEYSACAFTQKVLKFCTMMTRRGHTVFHYGHEKSQVECTEHISVTDDAVLEKAYGNHDWRAQQFKHNSSDFAHIVFNVRAAEEVAKRKAPGDFLLLFWGHGHGHVGKVHANDMLVVEPGIGSYNKLFAPFAVFESYAVMEHVYGKYNMSPRFMDAVVPNYFDPDDFIDATDAIQARIGEWCASKPPHTDRAIQSLHTIQSIQGPYVLMIARLIQSKGVQLAIEICKAAHIKLVIAGQGRIEDYVSKDFQFELREAHEPLAVTHIGYVEPNERAVLIARAKCLLAPTLYSEPFGGVNVEAQMSGIPVVTTDWGAFAETVVHGITGYRCRTMDHFLWAIKNVEHLDRSKIRRWALSNYGLSKVATMYEEYFSMVSSIQKGRGFYQEHPGRLGLSWLQKAWPN